MPLLFQKLKKKRKLKLLNLPKLQNQQENKSRKSKPSSKKTKQPNEEDVVKMKKELEEFRYRLVSELENGIYLNKPSSKLKPEDILLFTKQLGNELKITKNIKFGKIENSYILEELDVYFDSESIEAISKTLDNCNLVEICAESRFYGLDEEALQQCEIDHDKFSKQSKFQCNEIIFKTDDTNIADEISFKLRENFKEIVWTLYEIIYNLPKSILNKNIFNKLNKFKDTLDELDKERVKLQFELKSLKSKKNRLSVTKDSIGSRSKSKSPQKTIISKTDMRDYVVEKIKESDIFDLKYYNEIIEQEKRNLEEKMKIYRPITKFLEVAPDKGGKSTPKLGYSVERTIAELLQSKYAGKIKTDLTIDLEGYVLELNKLKPLLSDPPRKKRDNINIHILNRIKTNMDYKRNKVFLSNPRNPFKLIDCVNYDLDSDDSDNDEKVTDLEEVDDKVEDLTHTPSKNIRKGDETGEENINEYAENEEYKKRFGIENVSKGPTILLYKNQEKCDKEIDFYKIRLLTKLSKIKFPNNNPIPKLSDGMISNLKQICEMVHGSYASKNQLICSITVKCLLSVEDIEPYFSKVCMKERRISDEVSRWYIDDNILDYLKISLSEAKEIAESKNQGESK